MIKSIYFTVFSLFLCLAFAFTPVIENVPAENGECIVEELPAPCNGYIKLETSCISPSITNATIEVTDPIGNPIYTGPANGYIPLQLMLPGSYEIEISVPLIPQAACSGTIGWEFCGGLVSNTGTNFTFASGLPANFGFTIP